MTFSPEEIADLAHAELTLGADPDGWRRFWRRSIELSGTERPATEIPTDAPRDGRVDRGGDGIEGCDCWQCAPLGVS